MQSVLVLAWSEYYLPFAPLYDWLQQHGAGMIAITFTSIAGVCLLQNRALGAVVFVLAALASYRQFTPSIPMPIVASKAVVPAFAAATVLCILAFEFRRTKRLVSVSLLLLFPPVLYLLGVLNGNLTLGAPWPYLVFVLICAAAGLLGLSVHCLSPRPMP